MDANQGRSWKSYIAPILAVLLGVAMFAGMFAFQFFKVYMLAVLGHWVALMSGGVSVLVSFYKDIRRTAGKYVLYVVAGMCVFFAGFQSWQDQYRIADDKQEQINSKQKQLDNLTKPDLRGEIYQAIFSRSGDEDQDSLIIITAGIKNFGAPSIIEGIGMRLKLTNGKEIHLVDLPPPSKPLGLSLPNGRTPFHLDRGDYLLVKAGERPNSIRW